MIADLALLGGFAVVAAAACHRLKPGVVLAVAVVLSVLQIYITTTFAVSLATVWQVAALVTVHRHRAALPRPRLVPALFAAYFLLSLLAVAWSPDRMAGLALCAQLTGLGVTAAVAAIVIVQRRTSAALLALTTAVAISAASIILFRFVPRVEDSYFHSWAFGFLNGRELADGFFTIHRNNALDKLKAGGLFFVNANAASLFCGAAGAVVAMFASRLSGLRRVAVAAVVALDFAAVLATGSKTGVYLAALAVLTLAAVLVVRQRQRGLLRAAGLGGAAVALALVVLVALPAALSTPPPVQTPAATRHSAGEGQPRESPAQGQSQDKGEPLQPVAVAPKTIPTTDLANQSMDALGTRVRIWRIGLQLFEQHPFGGFGYGGWAALYGPLALQTQLNPAFPPHDWVIQVWSDTGLLSLLVVFALIVALAVRAVRPPRGAGRPRMPELVLSGVALGWILLHGLADNTGVYGGPRLLVIAAFTVAVLLVPRMPRTAAVTHMPLARSQQASPTSAPARASEPAMAE